MCRSGTTRDWRCSDSCRRGTARQNGHDVATTLARDRTAAGGTGGTGGTGGQAGPAGAGGDGGNRGNDQFGGVGGSTGSAGNGGFGGAGTGTVIVTCTLDHVVINEP